MNELVEVGSLSGLLYFIGTVLKQIEKVPNWTIPLVLLVLGALGFMGLNGWTVANAINGMYAAAGAVAGNQVLKQTTTPTTKPLPKPTP